MAKKQASEKKLNTEENGTEKTAEKNVKVEKTVEKNVKEGKTAEKNVKEGKTAEKNVKEGKTVEKNVKEGKTVEKNAQATEEGPKYTLFSLLTRGENRSVAVPFALTALAMLIVPVAVFFVVESALPDLGITDKNKILSYSGICAVISANIIMALYALHAYREEKRDWAAVQEKKRETKKKD
ncbi:hypothetical protein FOL47_009143 [Perkinsus chesapeaki]|uniref:Vacuolar ATPase assembly integral membrane protein VMA21 n=1 Tax=Perkinsus chesapeaki TaxID=330153 RepID=A0A7J6LA59_PERCH|nr:hypothetical protein FOL47_009143 [Perkinsus chesapeaki]